MKGFKRGRAGAIGALLLIAMLGVIVGAQQVSSGGALSGLLDYVMNGQWTFLNGITVGGTRDGSGPAYANSDQYKIIRKDSISDGVSTAVVTVTVPNNSHGAVIPIVIMGGLGTGGTLGEFEGVITGAGQVVVQRTSGATAVVTAATLTLTANAKSSLASAPTLSYGVSSVSGAVTATQTFTINVTITRGTGSSTDNHHAIIRVDCLNAQQVGITIS